MSTMITFDMITTFVIVLFVIFAALVSGWSAVKVIKELRKPTEDRDRRISILESRAEENAQHIRELNDATRLVLKSNSVLIDHLMTGDHQEELKDMRDELKTYLWNHVGSD